MNRINIDITADDAEDGNLVARLIAANLNQSGFEDVSNISHPVAIERDDEVVAAMNTLSPGIFQAEVVIDTSTFDTTPSGAAVGEDDEFPEPVPSGQDDDDDPVLNSDD
jgi:Tfp pilus assembly protein PilW